MVQIGLGNSRGMGVRERRRECVFVRASARESGRVGRKGGGDWGCLGGSGYEALIEKRLSVAVVATRHRSRAVLPAATKTLTH